MIVFSNVYLKYTKEFYALNNVSFKAKKGQVIAFLGPVDSGKTCIMRILAGLEKKSKGEVYIKDIPVENVDYQNDVAMGYISYKATFFEKKTVYENLKYVLKIRGFSEAEQETMINKALIDFRIENLKDEKIYRLSLFQRYLVSVVRLSFRKLEIVLIDNIFEELTEEENKKLIALFKKQFIKPNSVVIYATSDEEKAKAMSTDIIKIKYGVIEE